MNKNQDIAMMFRPRAELLLRLRYGQRGFAIDTQTYIIRSTDGLFYEFFPGGPGVDELVKISNLDTTSDFLESKIVAGAGILITKLNPAGNEQLEISTLSSAANRLIHSSVVHSGDEPYVRTSSVTYEVLARFYYPGSASIGTITSVEAVVTCLTSGKFSDLRIFDYTNGNIMAELLNIPGADFGIHDLGAINNVPVGGAIIEIQGRVASVNGDDLLLSGIAIISALSTSPDKVIYSALVHSGDEPYVRTSSPTYEVLGRIYYLGSTAVGAMTAIRAVGTCLTSGKFSDLRIFDLTNGNIISELLNVPGADFAVHNFAVIANIPANAAVLEVQGRVAAVNGDDLLLSGVALIL